MDGYGTEDLHLLEYAERAGEEIATVWGGEEWPDLIVPNSPDVPSNL